MCHYCRSLLSSTWGLNCNEDFSYNMTDAVKQEVDCSVMLAKQMIYNTMLVYISEVLPIAV